MIRGDEGNQNYQVSKKSFKKMVKKLFEHIFLSEYSAMIQNKTIGFKILV